jgi:FemAB-related protein (PEP-CTERM system-associated)
VSEHRSAPLIGTEELVVEQFDGDWSEWDAFVTESEGSTFCHLAGWRGVMREALGHECRYLVALDDAGRWHGVLPLVRVKSRLLGHYLISMPFLNYGGPLGTRPAQARLAARAVEEANRSGADLLELRTRNSAPLGLATSDRKITVLLELPSTSDALWNDHFRAKLRSQIRRPQKEGMEARFGPEHLEAFYSVFAHNMRDLGTPVVSRSFFGKIVEELSETVIFGGVYLRDEPVAAGCGFIWRDEFELSWASSLREYNRYSPNMLLYWAFMEEMIARDIRIFNFGRCTPGGGTHRFKGQWGGIDVPLPWAQWSNSGLTAPPSPDRPLFRIATTAWQRLPLTIANRLGPHLSRLIP